MRKFYSCCVCFFVVCAGSALGQTSTPKETAIFRLNEGNITISPGPPKEWDTCVLVQESGAVYVEKRSHLIAEPHGELKAYRGQLTQAEFDNLQGLLADSGLAGLWDSNSVRPAPTNTTLTWITVAINRGSSVQEIDYRYWSEQATEYATANPSNIATQKERLRLLTPVLNWARDIDTTNLQPAQFTHGMCVL